MLPAQSYCTHAWAGGVGGEDGIKQYVGEEWGEVA